MKKLFTLICAILLTCNMMAVNVWDGSSEPWTSGSGTALDPYRIETAANLAYLAEKVNEGYQAQGMAVFAGTHFYVTDDLDLNHINWTPIGNVNTSLEGYYFAGVFDGGFHEISHLKIVSDAEVTGLFAGAADGPDGFSNPTIIRNLFVTGAEITSTGVGAGGIAGIIAGYTLVYRCSFSGSISVSGNGTYCGGGGIVALAAQYSRVQECCFDGSFTASNGSFTGAAAAAGIMGVALNGASVQSCHNTGTITGSAMFLSVAAGIVATVMEDNEASILSCYNVGSLNAITKGGIFGMVSPINPMKGENELSVQNCYYLNSTASSNGYGTGMSAEEMRTEQFKNQLDQSGHHYVMDNGTNDGYPIHSLASFDFVQATDINCYSAKLSALIHQGNDHIARAYFIYKLWDENDYVEVDVPTDGYVEVVLEGLVENSTYEYGMVVQFDDDIFMEGAPMYFSTMADAVSETDFNISVYPNPTIHQARIDGVEVAEIQVFNALGQRVGTIKGTNEVSVEGLSAGHYLLRVTDKEGRTRNVRLVVGN